MKVLHPIKPILAISLAWLLWALNAQGGPPLLTDDPDTPGPNHWEINAGGTATYGARQWDGGVPLLDINYGVGQHIQLKYQVQASELDRAHGGLLVGMSNSLAGVKWRFLDQTNSSWLEISTYPQLEFVYPGSAGRRGLADRGDNLLLPIEVEHIFKRATVYAEVGYYWYEYEAKEAWYGLAGEYELSEKFSLMAEFYGGFVSDFRDNALTFNLGFRRTLTEHVALIGSAGRGIFGPAQRAPAFMSYLALQLTF
ncbi:MAG TPA: hypothetical protein VMR33_01180 [Candidatus Baltobacteraceae bacterium]|nr:hypothetical protein [Candidatus Baltobacteraceae bacterium]